MTGVQLAGWKLLERFLVLIETSGGLVAPGPRETHGLRELDRRTYFGLFLSGLFNPVVGSMRSLCAATCLDRVRETLGRDGPVAISRFSDARRVFALEIREPVMSGLLAESFAHNLPGIPIGRITPEMIRVVDSTLWKVAPRMGWAEWRCQGVAQSAVRLHVKLRHADLQPDRTEITGGKTCERAAIRRMLKPGEFYLGDRRYGTDHGLFGELDTLGCGYVLRLNTTTILEVVENHPVPPAATAQGAPADGLMKIGAKGRGG